MKVSSTTLEIDSFPGTTFLVPNKSALAMGLTQLMKLADGYRWLLLAAENQRNSGEVDCPTSFISRVFGDCDCGGEVVVVGVEAVSTRWVVDRRVLTADVDAGLGLITCERSGFNQTANLKSSVRSGAGRSPDSSHKQ